MPGRPIIAAGIRRLEEFGLEPILDMIVDGQTLNTITAAVGVISRPTLSQWLLGKYKGAGETDEQAAARAALYKEARALSAYALGDDALDAVDAEKEPRAAQLARNRAELRLKVAGLRNRDEFGDKPQVAIQLNFGSLHLDALRRRQVTSAPAEIVAPEGDGEPTAMIAAGS